MKKCMLNAKFTKPIIFLLVLILLLFVSAYSNNDMRYTETEPVPVTSPTEATEPETKPETEPQPTEALPTEPQGVYNQLTGLYDLEENSPTRPIAFMIGNNPPSRPQYGIDKADMYVEAETEGGITRIMAVFSSIDKVPSQIGPIRSARTPFINMANALDAIYVHCGASKAGFSTLRSTGINEIDALYSSRFWRDSYLKEAKGYEYSLMTSKDMLYGTVTSSYAGESCANSPFEFKAQKLAAPKASYIQTELSGSETASFTYDSSSNSYYKLTGSLDGANKHITADGTPITVKNVIVIYADKYWENDITINFNLYSGSAKLFTGGGVRDISWSRDTKQLFFYEDDGSKASVNMGKTYILIADESYKSSLIYY